MGKRLSNFNGWHGAAAFEQPSTRFTLQLLAAPLLLLATLLLLGGVFTLSPDSIAIGVIGLLAGLALRRHGRDSQRTRQS